jgi:hypothetical protein
MRHLPQKERDKFSAAMAKEWRNILELDAVKVLGPVEAEQVRLDPNLAQRIRRSRRDLTEKLQPGASLEDLWYLRPDAGPDRP